MYVFHRVGANYAWLRGQCAVDSVLLLRLKDGEYSVRLEPVAPDQLWPGYADQNGRTWEGFFPSFQPSPPISFFRQRGYIHHHQG